MEERNTADESHLTSNSDIAPLGQQQIMHQSFQIPPNDISAAGLQQVMTPRAWDAVINNFDADVDPVAMASFIEPYLFFDGEIS